MAYGSFLALLLFVLCNVLAQVNVFFRVTHYMCFSIMDDLFTEVNSKLPNCNLHPDLYTRVTVHVYTYSVCG